jgi:chaperone modulatory protein CbpM
MTDAPHPTGAAGHQPQAGADAGAPWPAVSGVIVETEISFSLTELCRACDVGAPPLAALVDEGVLQPQGSGPGDWSFDGSALRTARTALRLVDDLALSPAAAALVLDLLAQIAALQSRLTRIRPDRPASAP